MAEPGDPLNTDPDDALWEDIPEPDAEPAPKTSDVSDAAEPVRPSFADPIRPEPAPLRTAPPQDVHHHAHDDLIGFTSASALGGVSCPPGWGGRAPEPESEAEPDLFDLPSTRPVNRLAALRAEAFGAAPAASAATSSAIDPVAHLPQRPTETQRTETREAAPQAAAPEPAEGAMGLFAVYALLLGAVPTLGASALVALVAVTVRPRPTQPLARSHFDFQKRTVWIAAVAAVLGVVLIAVNIGVVALFILAVWMLARSAWGLLRLARGAAIRKPRQWLIADLLA